MEPKILKRLYFVRHGETELNVSGCYNFPDTPLTEQGVRQAEFVGERARNLSFERIISSPNLRAHETAQRISLAKDGMPITLSPLFQEFYPRKEFLGKPSRSMESKMMMDELWNHARNPEWHYSDEENIPELLARSRAALRFLVDAPEKEILVATHGTFLKFLLLAMMLETDEAFLSVGRQFVRFLPTYNTGVTIVELSDSEIPRWTLLVWNDRAHLG